MKSSFVIPLLVLAASAASAHPGHEAATVLLLAAAGDTQPTPAKTTTTGDSQVSITIEGNYRMIRANGLPNHPAGQFPNRGNPNRISPQNYQFRVPANPTPAGQPTPLGMYPFGVAVNGVVFDPGAAEWWGGDPDSGWQFEPMSGAINLGVDQNNAHVQPNGAYHYHAIPRGLLDALTGGKPKMVLVGWAADGFPIYGPWGYTDANNTNSAIKRLKSSYRVKSGARPGGPGGKYDGSFVADYEFVKSAGDLDEANGRFGLTPEHPKGTYYYVLTDDFPFIPRLFKGTPDSSFFRQGPGGRRGGPRGMGGPPPGGRRGRPDGPPPPP